MDNIITGQDFFGDYIVILRVMAEFGLAYWLPLLFSFIVFFIGAMIFRALEPDFTSAKGNLGFKITTRAASWCMVYLGYAAIYKLFFT